LATIYFQKNRQEFFLFLSLLIFEINQKIGIISDRERYIRKKRKKMAEEKKRNRKTPPKPLVVHRCGQFDVDMAPAWPTGESVVPPRVAMIAGFKRTGKDTIGKGLCSGVHEFPWVVYARPIDGMRTSAQREHHICVFDSFKNSERVALADKIRDIVSKGLRLEEGYDFDKNKDSTVIAGKLLRQHFIDIGAFGREIDPEFWTRHAFAPYFSVDGKKQRSVVCTDWRFENELLALLRQKTEAVTIRVFRSSVLVPPDTIDSEHNLKSRCTDYLILDTDHCFEQAVERWPFYRNHKKIGIMGKHGFVSTL
jgi:hypothetical protein